MIYRVCFLSFPEIYNSRTRFNLVFLVILIVGAKFPASALREQEVQDYHEKERQKIQKTMDSYLYICQRMGVIFLDNLNFSKLFFFLANNFLI